MRAGQPSEPLSRANSSGVRQLNIASTISCSACSSMSAPSGRVSLMASTCAATHAALSGETPAIISCAAVSLPAALVGWSASLMSGTQSGGISRLNTAIRSPPNNAMSAVSLSVSMSVGAAKAPETVKTPKTAQRRSLPSNWPTH